jgi:hypothetical protein
MDPVSSGAMKNVHQSVFEQAEQTLQKSNQQVSDFEKLREKLEQQDAIGGNQNVQKAGQADKVQQTNQIDAPDQVGNVKDLHGAEVPKIKDMDQLQHMVNDIRGNQDRLNQLLGEATSGKTYTPSELIALQSEVGRITNHLELATKVVESFVTGVKTAFNMQF